MVKYETLFIIRPDQSPDEIQVVIDRLVERVERAGGKVAIVDHWGVRDLAYLVKYRGERLVRGYYVLLTYVGDGAAVEEVERNLKILDPTFRYLSVKLQDGADPAAIGEIEVIRREQRRPRHDAPKPSDEEGGGEAGAAPGPGPAEPAAEPAAGPGGDETARPPAASPEPEPEPEDEEDDASAEPESADGDSEDEQDDEDEAADADASDADVSDDDASDPESDEEKGD